MAIKSVERDEREEGKTKLAYLNFSYWDKVCGVTELTSMENIYLFNFIKLFLWPRS